MLVCVSHAGTIHQSTSTCLRLSFILLSPSMLVWSATLGPIHQSTSTCLRLSIKPVHAGLVSHAGTIHQSTSTCLRLSFILSSPSMLVWSAMLGLSTSRLRHAFGSLSFSRARPAGLVNHAGATQSVDFDMPSALFHSLESTMLAWSAMLEPPISRLRHAFGSLSFSRVHHAGLVSHAGTTTAGKDSEHRCVMPSNAENELDT